MGKHEQTFKRVVTWVDVCETLQIKYNYVYCYFEIFLKTFLIEIYAKINSFYLKANFL